VVAYSRIGYVAGLLELLLKCFDSTWLALTKVIVRFVSAALGISVFAHIAIEGRY
jgi:hypothetical protein